MCVRVCACVCTWVCVCVYMCVCVRECVCMCASVSERRTPVSATQACGKRSMYVCVGGCLCLLGCVCVYVCVCERERLLYMCVSVGERRTHVSATRPFSVRQTLGVCVCVCVC